MNETMNIGNQYPVETTERIVLRLETNEQKSTLQHPIRSKILKVLGAGTLYFQVTTDNKEKMFKDGTGITRLVSTKTPFQRHWMTVAEIQEAVDVNYPYINITDYRWVYHLQKLVALGMVEQFPPATLDESGNKQRSRGKYFRTTARYFVSCLKLMSPEIIV